METFFYDSQFDKMKKDVVKSISKSLSIETARRRVEVNDVWVDDTLDPADFASQAKAVKADRTWGVPVYASLNLIDKTTGKKLSSVKKMRIATLPKNTVMGSFIVKGKHYQVSNQLRRKPGVYVVERENREVESQFSVPGKQFSIRMDPETQKFFMHVGQSDQPLYPTLSRMGISDSTLAKAWGEDVLRANKNVTAKMKERSVKTIAKNLMGQEYESADVAAADLRNHLEGVEVSPSVTKATVGKEYKSVTTGLLVDASRELLRVHSGERQPDEAQSIVYKKVMSVSDFIKERVETRSRNVRGRIVSRLSKLDPPTDIGKVVVTNEITPVIEEFFTRTDLSSTPDQTNPIHMLNGLSNITIMGEGGIRSEYGVKESERALHPSHLGFIDPVHTPDSQKIGVTMHLASGVKKTGTNELATATINVKTGKGVYLTPGKVKESIVALPDQYDLKSKKFKGRKVRALVNGEVQVIDASKVTHVLSNAKQAFSIASNLIPFLPSTQGNRSQMSTKMTEQAIPLLNREAPLVRTKLGDSTWEEAIGGGFSVKATDDGVVTSVSKDRVTVKGKKGKKGKKVYKLADNFPLNNRSFIDQKSNLSVGDRVKSGDVIADSNFTRDGVLAVGTNLRTAYIPYKGYNFEDGIVITQGAAKKLTSEHMYQYAEKIDKASELSLDSYTGWKSGDLTVDQQRKLGDDGVVKKGQVLHRGDPLWVGVRENKLDPDSIIMAKYTRIDPKKAFKKEWDHDEPGKVIDVVRSNGQVKVYVKTMEPAKIGDKLSNRAAAKGIITKIIPDNDAPRTSDGEPIDILLNPHGVVSRINPSQLLETVAGKISEKTGKAFVVDNFSGEKYADNLAAELKRLKMSDKEDLFDANGTLLGSVLVGKQYTVKLSKQATSQFSARASGKYDTNKSPLRGGDDGAKALDLLSMYSMLSHGSRVNLREMATYKATQNQEFWNWLQVGAKWGKARPSPEPTFAYKKFEAYLKGAGVDVKRKGSKLVLTPLTEREVTNLSSGEVKEPLFLRGKDLQKTKGGLLDPLIHGDDGSRWSHYNLAEPVPNPVFEEPIKKLLGLSNDEFKNITYGKVYYNPKDGTFNQERKGITGGAAIRTMLKKIDLDKLEKDWKVKMSKTRSAPKRNDANKILRYIGALKENGLKPHEAYILRKLPIIPPAYRPVYPLPDGSLGMSGVNNLYRDVGLVNNELKWQNSLSFIPDTARQELRENLYEGVRALAGVSNASPITYYQPSRRPKGFIAEIKGDPAKIGFFQSKVLRRQQDLVGRGTIIPEPKLGIDEVGLPKDMAWEVFKPFVVQDLVSSGMDPNAALDAVEERSVIAKASLDMVMKDRPVMLNRAPSLHKFSIMAFKPQITEGRAIKIPPLIVKGFNADFDGDQQVNSVLALIPECVYKIDITTWNQRRVDMTARFKSVIGYSDGDGEFVICDLSEFPHMDSKVTKGHIDFHPVPPGIKVVALDEASGPVLAEVSGWSFHRNRQVEIVTLGSGKQIITDDDERAVYGLDASSLEWCRRRPSESMDQFVPVLSSEPVWNTDSPWKEQPLPRDGSGRLRESAPGNFEFGYFLGATVGDGWSSFNHNVARASNATVIERWKHASLSIFKETPTFTDTRITEGQYGNSKGSRRSTVGCTSAAEYIAKALGGGAHNKHLPPFFRTASKPFLAGLLSGLWDTDGSVSYSNAKKKPQLRFTYSSVSIRLIQEIQHLLRSMGVTSTITYANTPKKDPYWILGVSTVELHRINLGLELSHPTKKTNLGKFLSGPAPDDRMAYSRYRLVPIPAALATELRGLIDRKKYWSLYVTTGKAIERKYMSKVSARALLGAVPQCGHPLFGKWRSIVENDDYYLERVKSVEVTDAYEDGYDLTVPGYETFMSTDGVILSNTMTVHVPIFDDAVEEAKKMLPSKNLYNPGTGEVVIMPMNEAALGLYQLSKTKEGRASIDAALPKKLKGKYDVLDKKGLKTLVSSMASEEPSGYGKSIDKLKELGDTHTYKTGFTVSMKDLRPSITGKDKLISSLNRSLGMIDTSKPQGREAAVSLIRAADKELVGVMKSVLKKDGNGFFQMVDSGARGNMGQLKQIVSAPMLVDDHRGNPSPFPITSSYANGLNFSDYWSTLYGARRVAMDKQLQTRNPGAFTKDIMASALGSVISSPDCETHNGVKLSVNSRDVANRYLANDVRIGGTVVAKAGSQVNSQLVKTLRDRKVKTIKVRSPLTCSMPKGVCAKCYGDNDNGETADLGDNVGATSAQALSEPLTQMTLRTFHSGGLSGSRTAITGYSKIDKLLKMTEIRAGKATLATRAGKVEKRERAAGGVGSNLWIDGVKHYIPPGAKSKVKIGSVVEKGDAVTDGVIQPQELAGLKGMLPAQEYIVDEVQRAYAGEGVNLKRRAIETIVRSVGNVTRVTSPGDSNFITHDIIPLTVAEDFNRQSLGKIGVSSAVGKVMNETVGGFKMGTKIDKDVAKALKGMGAFKIDVRPSPIGHAPFLSGVTQVPLLSKDWMARLGYQHLESAIVKGVGRGDETDLHGFHPIPAFAYGAEFGDERSGAKGGKY